MTNDLNDHIFRFSCFVMSMQTAIIQGVKNCLPLGLADGAVSTDPSPTRQNGRRRPTSWARTGSMMLFSTATNLRLGFSQGGYFNWHPLQTCRRGGQNPVANRDSLGWRHKNYRHQQVGPISDRSIETWLANSIHRKRDSRIAFFQSFATARNTLCSRYIQPCATENLKGKFAISSMKICITENVLLPL